MKDDEYDTTPLVGGDKGKPQVANRENFHVHGLYPPLGSLGKQTTLFLFNSTKNIPSCRHSSLILNIKPQNLPDISIISSLTLSLSDLIY